MLKNLNVVKVRMLLVLMLLSLCVFSCTDDSEERGTGVLTSTITGYNIFGAMELSTGRQDMAKAGFTPGDILTVSFGDKVMDMPYFTGFFTKPGGYLVLDYPGAKNTTVTANNVGIKRVAPDMEGKEIKFRLKEKGAVKDVEETLAMQYSNDRKEYESDEVFANARAVKTTGLADGVLFRSSSPFDNRIARRRYVADFLERNGVRTALNLTDDQKSLSGYKDIPAYSQRMIDEGNVVLCKLNMNYSGEEFNHTLVAGLIEMMNHPAPYVVHCTEGKDRTGYVCALLEALAGASYDEIIADYLVTYYNYFHITQQTSPRACELLLELRLDDAMSFFCIMADGKELKTTDLSQAVQDYLKRYGMSDEQVERLIGILKGRG